MSLPWPLGTGQPREKHNYQPAKLWLRVESCVVRGCTKKVLTMWGHSSLSTLLLLSIAIHQYKIKLFNWKRTRSEIYIDTVKTENIDIFTWSSCFAKSININNSYERTNVLHHLSPLGAIIIIDPMPLLGVSHFQVTIHRQIFLP